MSRCGGGYPKHSSEHSLRVGDHLRHPGTFSFSMLFHAPQSLRTSVIPRWAMVQSFTRVLLNVGCFRSGHLHGRCGFTLLEMLAVVMIAGIMVAGGYPKLTDFLWEVKLEQQARMVHQDLLLFVEATVTAGPGNGPLARLGVAMFENKNYVDFGYRISRYSLLDPLGRLAEFSMSQRDLARDGFCLIPTDHTGQPITDDTIEIRVTDEGRIASPTWPIYFQLKAFDPDTGETEDSVAWNIIVDPLDSRIRLQRANTGR